MRVRFAPSPTGNVHIGNIRVAIFNWLLARHNNGKFLLRIEDTDLERSTPEAIEKMLQAMTWLNLDYDEKPLYQTARRHAHDAALAQMVSNGSVMRRGPESPLALQITHKLFDKSFISEPRDHAEIKLDTGKLVANKHAIVHTVISPNSGNTYVTPINWDTLHAPKFVLFNGQEIDAEKIRERCGENSQDLVLLTESNVVALKFTRRYVFFNDLVLGLCEKPLDSLRDFVVARNDGSPVFHLANVVDDIFQEITHVLRGNDHVENTFRHLFIFKALNAPPPQYGHFPMIVNHKGKPYSKRDGDAYIGDFQEKGFLPTTLFNFLALCGWAPGDDREIMPRDELVTAFTLERVNKSAAQFDTTKLSWMNQQYIKELPDAELIPLLKAEVKKAGFNPRRFDDAWYSFLASTQRERLEKISDFIPRTRYFFTDDYAYDKKAVEKTLRYNDGEGLRILREFTDAVLRNLTEWTVENIPQVAHDYIVKMTTPEKPLFMNQITQPLRVACTGSTASPGIGETLFLLGREATLKRIERTIQQFAAVV